MKALQLVQSGWSIAARILVPLLLLALAAAAVWVYGIRQYRAGVEAGRADVREEWRDEIDEANMRAAQAGHRYEEWKMRQAPRDVTITRRFPVRSKLLLTGVTLVCLTGCATRSNAPLPTLLPANLTQPCDLFQPPPLANNSDMGRASSPPPPGAPTAAGDKIRRWAPSQQTIRVNRVFTCIVCLRARDIPVR